MIAVAGLIAIGAGLAAGFPVMLGFIGNKFAELSGTAFSIVLTIALLGNMIVNFLMGVIAEKFGIHHLPTMAFGLTVIMITLFAILRKKSNL
jgi:fucose permease